MSNTKRNKLSRFSISMRDDLLAQLDKMAEQKGYCNRSQAIADMVRSHLVEYRAYGGKNEIAGAITLVYDHHRRDIQKRLTEMQHKFPNLIISTTHCHLDHHNCLEIIAVRGLSSEIRKLADSLIATRGIKHGKLSATTTGKDFEK